MKSLVFAGVAVIWMLGALVGCNSSPKKGWDIEPPEVVSRSVERERLKEEIKEELKREILAELRQQQNLAQTPEAQKPPQEGTQQKPPSSTEQVNKGPAGTASGRILSGQEGYSGCKVKLIRMVPGDSLLEAFKSFQEGAEFDTTTNEKGIYTFRNIPVGSYWLKWQPPDKKYWIRKLSDKPDLVVRENETARMKDIDIQKIVFAPE